MTLLPIFLRTLLRCLLIGTILARQVTAQGLDDTPYVPTPSVIKGTIAALSDSNDKVVLGAIQELAEWRAAEAGNDMTRLLGGGRTTMIRTEALQFFVRLGAKAQPFIAAIIPFLGDTQAGVRERSLQAIASAGVAKEHLQSILPLLADARKEVRVAAATCIGTAGKAAKPHRDTLMKALARAGSPEFKTAIMDALTQIGDMPAADAERLLPFISDRESEVRIAACSAIFNAIIDAKASGDTSDFSAMQGKVVQRFRSEPVEIRGAMLKHAITDAEAAKIALEGLAREVNESQPEAKKRALFALGMAGDAALPQLSAVVAQYKSEDPEMRAAVLAALRGIGKKAVEPNMELVVRALLDSSEAVRAEALLTLPLCGATLKNRPYKIADVFPTASPEIRETLLKSAATIILALGVDTESLEGVQKAFADPSTDYRVAACFIAGQLGSKGGDTILLNTIALTADKEPAVQGAAAISLRSFTGRPEDRARIRAALRPLLMHNDDQVRWAALDTIAEAEPGAEASLVNELADLLNDPDRSVRNAAVRALGFAGVAAKAHFSRLVAMFNDDPEVPPFAAARSILQISPLTSSELSSLLNQAYQNEELLPLVRLTAHGASGGQRDNEILIGLLDQKGESAKAVLKAGEVPRAIQLLQDAAKSPSAHPRMKQQIEARIAEITKLK